MMKKYPGQSGFTLIEMVIVLGIVASLMGAFFSFYQPTRNAQSRAATVQNMNRVMNALSSYLLMNKRLPCPIDVNVDPIVGLETCTAGVTRGIIPYSTLGLSQDDAKDGYGRYMTYIVHTGARNTVASVDSASSSYFCQTPIRLTISRQTVNAAGNLVALNETQTAIVAIVDHGDSGAGGYNMAAPGGSRGNPPMGGASGSNNALGLRERGNAIDVGGTTPTTINVGERIDRTDNNTHFDDIATYATGPGLVSRLGVAGCH